MLAEKLLIVNVAGLGWNLVEHNSSYGSDLNFKKLETVFPAVTCPVQASFRTGVKPAEHNLISNGLYLSKLKKVSFWEQSAALIDGSRIWADARQQGKTVGMFFWQQSLGEDVDMVLSPKPIHKHHGGMLQDCYSQPENLYSELCEKIGRPFDLKHYWGPLASYKSSDWIVSSLKLMLQNGPDIILGYLPHLDYDQQRFGPESKQSSKAYQWICKQLIDLRLAAREAGYSYLFFGDYAIEAVPNGAVFPNKALYEAGLLATRKVAGRLYPDYFNSSAFSVVDHQVANVYLKNDSVKSQVVECLSNIQGIESVSDGISKFGGELLLTAKKGYWFAYPWWSDKKLAPDYATHVDIHNKPGYDPCELFVGWPPFSVSLNANRVCGSHGRVGEGLEVAWSTDLDISNESETLIDLVNEIKLTN